MNTQEYERSMKLKEQSEKLFREKCDENDFTYLYIDQEQMTFSSRLWKKLSKRPDYLLSVPHIGSIFVDVKAYSEKIYYKDEHDFFKQTPPRCFQFEVEELVKYDNLQSEASIKVWFAIMPVQEDTVTREIYFIPRDRIQKFMLPRHYAKSWPYVKVPKRCFTDCNRLAYNVCNRCKERYCYKLANFIKKYETQRDKIKTKK